MIEWILSHLTSFLLALIDFIQTGNLFAITINMSTIDNTTIRAERNSQPIITNSLIDKVPTDPRIGSSLSNIGAVNGSIIGKLDEDEDYDGEEGYANAAIGATALATPTGIVTANTTTLPRVSVKKKEKKCGQPSYSTDEGEFLEEEEEEEEGEEREQGGGGEKRVPPLILKITRHPEAVEGMVLSTDEDQPQTQPLVVVEKGAKGKEIANGGGGGGKRKRGCQTPSTATSENPKKIKGKNPTANGLGVPPLMVGATLSSSTNTDQAVEKCPTCSYHAKVVKTLIKTIETIANY